MTARIQLEPAAQQFADATSKPPFLFELGPIEGRQTVDKVQSEPIDRPDVDVKDLVISSGSQPISIRILKPLGTTQKLPVILYLHGAGWVFGNSHTHDRLVRELAVGAEAAVVFVSYSLSPEARYPVALEQCYAALQWVAEQGDEHGLDADRLAVAGDSVGGNLTAAVTLLAKERGGPSIGSQLLFYPVTDAAFDTGSYNQFAEGYFLSRAAMKWFWDQYIPDGPQRSHPTVSPLRATIEQLQGLPETLIITAEADVLRDEGEAYANRLREAGVPVTAVRFQGIIHDFVMLNAMAETYAKQAAILLATGWLKQQFCLQ